MHNPHHFLFLILLGALTATVGFVFDKAVDFVTNSKYFSNRKTILDGLDRHMDEEIFNLDWVRGLFYANFGIYWKIRF